MESPGELQQHCLSLPTPNSRRAATSCPPQERGSVVSHYKTYYLPFKQVLGVEWVRHPEMEAILVVPAVLFLDRKTGPVKIVM